MYSVRTFPESKGEESFGSAISSLSSCLDLTLVAKKEGTVREHFTTKGKQIEWVEL